MNDPVNRPKHYQGCSKLTRHVLIKHISSKDLNEECIDVIEKYSLGFHEGNAIKYLWRAGNKDDIVTDLKKALWYLERNHSNQSNIDWSDEIKLIMELIQVNL